MLSNLKMVDGMLVAVNTNTPSIPLQESINSSQMAVISALMEAANEPSSFISNAHGALQHISTMMIGAIKRNVDDMNAKLSKDVKFVLANRKSILLYNGNTSLKMPRNMLRPTVNLTPKTFDAFVSRKLNEVVRVTTDKIPNISQTELVNGMVAELVDKPAYSHAIPNLYSVIYGEDEITELSKLDKRLLISELESFEDALNSFDILIATISEYVAKTQKLLSSLEPTSSTRNNPAKTNSLIAYQLRFYTALSITIVRYSKVVSHRYTKLIQVAKTMINNTVANTISHK